MRDISTDTNRNSETTEQATVEVLVGATAYEIHKTDIKTNPFHQSMDSCIDRIHQVEKIAIASGQLNIALSAIGMEAKLRGLTSARAEGWMNSKSSYAQVITVASPRLPEHEADDRFLPQVVGSETPMQILKNELLEGNES